MPIKQPRQLNVLFIGNSFTARNNVPALIGSLAAARDLYLDHRLISVGGASLRMHWNRGQALEAMQRTKYDYVVLQEQSTLPVKNRSRMHENVRLFDSAIRATGARTALYMTWARLHAPETQDAIREAYASIGREIGATVVPVGVAWQKFLAKHDLPRLHDKDKSHPTLAGSYLAACVFFATLSGASPVGIASQVKGLSPQDVNLLQQAAWDSVKDFGVA